MGRKSCVGGSRKGKEEKSSSYGDPQNQCDHQRGVVVECGEGICEVSDSGWRKGDLPTVCQASPFFFLVILYSPGFPSSPFSRPSLRIAQFPLPGHLSHIDSTSLEMDAQAIASVPDMFINQKAYAHAVLAQDAFPRFLRAKAFGNLTPFTSFVRLLVGLLITWAGLTAAFCFVFLDIRPRRLRLTVRRFVQLSLLLKAD